MNPGIKRGKILNCKTCGKEVYCRPSLMNRDRWCSKKCWWKFRKIDGLKQRTGKNIICTICGKEKYYNGFRINKLSPKFCSNECKYEFFIRKNIRKGVYIKCGGCEKMIYAPPRKINRKVYCSKVCAGKNNILNLGSRMLGKKHNDATKMKMSKASLGKRKKKPWEYKQSIGKLFRRFNEYSLWRKGIFERDKFYCQNCNKLGGELNAHHIIPFSIIVRYVSNEGGKENLLVNLLKFPLALDKSNGITLCRKCHKGTDNFLKAISKSDIDYYFKKIDSLLIKK